MEHERNGALRAVAGAALATLLVTLTPGAPAWAAPAPAQTSAAAAHRWDAAQPVLRQGHRGAAVRRLQQLLLAAGYSPGPIDGIFGPRTLRAVRQFQRDIGLTVDGVVGSRTWAALATEGSGDDHPDTGFAWPARSRVITSRFGWRERPCPACSSFHKGLDIAGAMGDPAMASKAGTVVYAGWARGYGLVVYINHPDGSQTRYAHLSAIYVRQSQQVRQGQVIGAIGNTGVSAGPHLHFEIRWGNRAVDPLPYLA